ncbi:MAG: hypothetical protein QM739_16665 [Propionivibrio sp.]
MSDQTIFLYGTDEAPTADRLLVAGALTAYLGQDGNLREIRFRGVEVLRALAFLVRTEGWGTPKPVISNLAVDDESQGKDQFTVSYDAKVRDGDARLTYHIEISGIAAGLLEARATIRPNTDFPTNRTGFIVLHPLVGVAGLPATVEHASGSTEETTLPSEINPAQPVRDIRAITTFPASGLAVTARFDGDVFEMEDQRNWSDASFKTYSRPLTLPFPYVLEAGKPAYQSVTLTVNSKATALPSNYPGFADSVAVRLGKATGQRLPDIGIAVPAELARASARVAAILRDAAPSRLVAHFDPTLGHGLDELIAFRELSEAVGSPVTLEIILPGKEAPVDEFQCAAALADLAGLRPTAIAVFPKIDEQSFQPGEVRPPAPELKDIYAAARSLFPGVRLGGGTPAFFTELNRKHPPADLLNYVTHGTCPTVHAADDVSVMQTLETLPWIARSARKIAGTADYHIGPVAIGARINPYGRAPSPNPRNARVGLAEIDPRQRGLFGAAWYLGYAATVAPLGVSELVLAGTVGPFGIVFDRQAYSQPWFDEISVPSVFPVFHVVAALSAAAGSPLIEVEVTAPDRVAVLAWGDTASPQLAIANLTAEAQVVNLVDWPPGDIHGRLLDTDSFERAALAWSDFRERDATIGRDGQLILAPYAVALIGDPP